MWRKGRKSCPKWSRLLAAQAGDGWGSHTCFCACKSNTGWDHSLESTMHRVRIWDFRTPLDSWSVSASFSHSAPVTVKLAKMLPPSCGPPGWHLNRCLRGAQDWAASLHTLETKALSDAPHEALFQNYSHFLNKGYQVIHTFDRAVLFVWIFFNVNIQRNKAKLTNLPTK